MGTQAAPARKPRDIRLDFFRGICLFIIFIAHTYGNAWANFIPARFGFSDATEIFVFCSGMASAIAFGATFERNGLIVGLGRVTFRIWQVYWAHVALFVVGIVLTIQTDLLFGGTGGYLRGLKFENLFNENAASAFSGVLLLTWVPPYFDILPMYLVLLCMLPVVILAAERSKPATALGLIAVWLMAHLFDARMHSVAWSDASWFFNPFGWQLVFFTGFAFMRGWIPAPPRDPRLITIAIVYVVVAIPLAWEPALHASDTLMAMHQAILPLIDKGKMGLLRFVHFLALAYLAYIAVGERGCRLRGPVVQVIAKVGTQSLGVFISGMLLSLVAGPFLNWAGRTYVTVGFVNIGGIAVLIGIAYFVGWYKSAPWSKPVVRDQVAVQKPTPAVERHHHPVPAVGSHRPRHV